jgi:hypothetical protein
MKYDFKRRQEERGRELTRRAMIEHDLDAERKTRTRELSQALGPFVGPLGGITRTANSTITVERNGGSITIVALPQANFNVAAITSPDDEGCKVRTKYTGLTDDEMMDSVLEWIDETDTKE